MIAGLTAAADERAILEAVVAHLRPWRPDTVELALVDPDADGRPRAARVVAAWQHGHVLADSPAGAAADLPDGLWTVPPAPALTSAPRAAVLPLHSAGHGGWQGALRLGWSGAHMFSPDEQAAYALVMAVLAAHLGGLRTQQALRASLTECELIHDLIREINLTTSLEQRLRVLVTPAPAPDEAEVVMCAFENDEQGAPTWLTVIHVVPAAGQPATSRAGTRYHLPSIPFARLYVSSPDAPLLISDIQSDPRVDDVARGMYAHNGVRATIVMALTLHGRWVGLLNISWLRPIALGDRERRIYQALAVQAALLLDHSLLVERLTATLQASRQQGELLQTVLDHIPVGVILLEAPASRPVIANSTATRMLGPQIYQVTAETMAARPYNLVYPGTDRPIPIDALPGVRVLATRKMETEELDVVAEGRDRVQLEATGVPMFDAQRAIKNVLLVLTDVTARKRGEAERLRLQDEMIRVQAAALAERSSPIIPITDDILVLPLVGSIDVERGQQVLATILEGAAQRRARVAIIDITGVGTVDTQAATALTGAARALRLLGVEPVLSGIRPDVAQTLVNLGIDLDGIATCGTLQSSIQYALRRLGRPGF